MSKNSRVIEIDLTGDPEKAGERHEKDSRCKCTDCGCGKKTGKGYEAEAATEYDDSLILLLESYVESWDKRAR